MSSKKKFKPRWMYVRNNHTISWEKMYVIGRFQGFYICMKSTLIETSSGLSCFQEAREVQSLQFKIGDFVKSNENETIICVLNCERRTFSGIIVYRGDDVSTVGYRGDNFLTSDFTKIPNPFK